MGTLVHNNLALSVLEDRYFLKDENNNPVETWEGLCRRVAKAVASVEEGENKDEYEEEFHKLMVDGTFLPSTPILMNAGLKDGALSACYVLPIEDDMESIFDTLKHTALVQKSGGGCIAKGSLVTTDNGPIKIEDIRIGDHVLSLSEDGVLSQWSSVEKIHKIDNTGHKIGTICFDGRKGSHVTTTDWHPFGVLRDDGLCWVRADELKVGDLVVSGKQSPINDIDELSYLYGVIVSDGSFDNSMGNTRLRIVKSNEDIIRRCAKSISKNYHKSYDKRYLVDMWELSVVNGGIPSHILNDFTNENGEYKAAKNAFIPKCIFSSTYTQQASFVAGLLDGDTYYNKEKQAFEYSTISYRLAVELQHLLSLMGIFCSFAERHPKQKSHHALFEIHIPFYLGAMTSIVNMTSRHNNVTIKGTSGRKIQAPYWLYDLAKTLPSGEYPEKVMAGEHGVYIGTIKWKKTTNIMSMLHILHATHQDVGDKYKLWMDLLPGARRVKNINWGEEVDLYDLTVEPHHTYMASTGGPPVMVHNTGFDFSKLRPINAPVGTHGGTSSGVVSFISIFNQAGEVIKQGGRRRSANMGLLRVDHPEIIDFIKTKEKDGVLSNFNLSVALTDDFMRQVTECPARPFECHHESVGKCYLDSNGKWFPVSAIRHEFSGMLTYGDIFDLICEKAWVNGEPGVVFIDTINKFNPAPQLGPITGVNPCAEEPLHDYNSCVLGSINLSKMVIDKNSINVALLKDVVGTAIRFLDNVVDLNHYPIPEIDRMTRSLRPIGLGVMGFADMLIKLEIRYGSQESLELAASIMQIINKTSHDYSEYLAKIRGAWAPGKKMRNCQVTTCAPTGTISMLAGCSSGIEPNFQWHYNRRAINQQFVEYHPLYLEYIGSCRSDEPLPDYFVTSDQVSWEEHVKMQAAFQQHVDASISKTINMPASATVDEVKTAILMAHELGCKGLTVYRDGSRTGQVISSAEVEAPGETKEKWEVVDEDQPLPRGEVMPRPSVTRGQTKRYQVACGKLYVTYAIEPVSGQPCEVFVQSSETGGCQANTKALGMMISKALRCGMDPDVIIHTLKKVSCPACRGKSGLDAKSCPDAVARALIELRPEIMDEDQEIQSTLTLEIKGDNEVEECEICPLEVKPCPDCGKGMIKQSGCWSCSYCGFSKCG